MDQEDAAFEQMAMYARRNVAPPDRRTLVARDDPGPKTPRDVDADNVRFELYHFPMSLCSNKVRMLLAEKEAEYGSHEVIIFPPYNENYHPAHAKLRLASEAARTNDLTVGYSGASAVQKMGFDPLVVPTLVDNDEGVVVAGSKEICLHIADCHRCCQRSISPPALRRTTVSGVSSFSDVVSTNPAVERYSI